jgi:hypothetical protein
MKRSCIKTGLVAAALGALLGGCATTVEMGPGYYHWDTRAEDLSSSAPAATADSPKVANAAPAVETAPVVVPSAPSVSHSTQVAPAPGAPRM